MDLLEEIGSLGFASRLRRLADRLHRDVSQIYREQEVDFEARWFPVLYALQDGRSSSITKLASDLGLTHPAINQIVGAMAKRGLVNSRKDRNDERRRLIALSKGGKELVGKLRPLWEEINAATSEMIQQSSKDLLHDLEHLEKLLERKSMYERVTWRLRQRELGEVEIIDYKPQFKRHFEMLNREWLETHFSVEEKDAEILRDPLGKLIRPGGAVIFVRAQGEIVGTAALLRHGARVFELTKMAVTARFRGHGLGRMLAEEAIKRARKLGAKELILLTSPKLEAAISLYHSLGFKNVEDLKELSDKLYRCSIAMRLKLK